MSLLRSPRFYKFVIAAFLALGGITYYKSSQSTPVDRGRYYRMTVGLTYKGQPIDIDFVAGCGVHAGRDLSGGSVREISGMTDLVRGVRMPEGHAVVINSYPWFESPGFNPCDGDTTSGGKIPKDWLPFIVWYERDDEFAHGVGYTTQDAYENKNARFGFRHASIERATRAEFEAFRKDGPANLLPQHQTDWLIRPTDPGYQNAADVPDSVKRAPTSGWWHTNWRTCTGVILTRLEDKDRAILREAWPRSHPDYWTDWDMSRHVESQIFQSHRQLFTNDVSLTRWQSSGAREPSPQVFPVAFTRALSRLTPATSPVEEADVLIGDGASNRGQVFCDVVDLWILEAVIGQPSKGGCGAVRVDGQRLPWEFPAGCSSSGTGSPFFHRDEYIITTIAGFRS